MLDNKTLSQILTFASNFVVSLYFCFSRIFKYVVGQKYKLPKNSLPEKFSWRICDSVSEQNLGIFAGRGALPQMLIEECQKNNKKFFLFLLEGENYEIDYSGFNPLKIAYGEVEKFLDVTRKNHIKELVFAGAVTKPNFSSLKVDKKGALLLAKIVASKILGDDAVLRAVIKFLEKEGLKIVALDQLFSDLVSKKGVLSKISPDKEDNINIEIAVKAIKVMSDFDIGQSVVVAQKQIVAVEALEGTDKMIARCLDLKTEYVKNSILVKLKKVKQSKKADLPTIGVTTINNCYAAGIKGIAIEAGSTLILERKKVIELVDELKMFLIAV
jgi:DUF1009 family protein